MWGERNCIGFETAVGGIEPSSPRLTVRRCTARPPLPTSADGFQQSLIPHPFRITRHASLTFFTVCTKKSLAFWNGSSSCLRYPSGPSSSSARTCLISSRAAVFISRCLTIFSSIIFNNFIPEHDIHIKTKV